MTDPDWILTKNSIIQKMKMLFEELQQEYRDGAEKYSTNKYPEVFRGLPKISRGENYLGLPWVILDYPGLFDKENILAVRTMFWWGKFFSITLHLSGKWKTELEEKISENLETLAERQFSICVSANQWLHHFEEDNYMPVAPTENIKSRPFIKIAKKYPLDRWYQSMSIFPEDFRLLTGVTGI